MTRTANWIVPFGVARMGLKIVFLGVAAAVVGFGTACSAPQGDAATSSSTASSPTASSPTASMNASVRAWVPPSVDVSTAQRFTASAESLHATIFESSAADLAPGATLTIGQGSVNQVGAHQWSAALAGAARFTIAGEKRDLLLFAPAGHVILPVGTYDVDATPTALVVRTISGRPALLYKPKGFFAWAARLVRPGDVGTVDAAHWRQQIVKHD